MDTSTYVRAVDALISRGQPVTDQSLTEAAHEVRTADRGDTAPLPSLPGQAFRLALAKFVEIEAGAGRWEAYREALESQGYEIRWSGTDPTRIPLDDDGTGHSASPTQGGPYPLLDHIQEPEPPQDAGSRDRWLTHTSLIDETRDITSEILGEIRHALSRRGGSSHPEHHDSQERNDSSRTRSDNSRDLSL